MSLEFHFEEHDVRKFLDKIVDLKVAEAEELTYILHDLQSGYNSASMLISIHQEDNEILTPGMHGLNMVLDMYENNYMRVKNINELTSEEELDSLSSNLYENFQLIEFAIKRAKLDEIDGLKTSLAMFIYSQNQLVANKNGSSFYVLKKDLRIFGSDDLHLNTSRLENVITSYDFMPAISRLISNSIDHSKVNNLEIEVAGHMNDNDYELIYTDNGVGIPEDKLELIFEKGFTTRENKEDHGLGLYGVREFLSENGGSIKAVPYDKGARFKIVIPSKYVIQPHELNQYLNKQIK